MVVLTSYCGRFLTATILFLFSTWWWWRFSSNHHIVGNTNKTRDKYPLQLNWSSSWLFLPCCAACWTAEEDSNHQTSTDCLGSFFCEGALASSLYPLIEGGLLSKYCFIKLMKHNTTSIGTAIVVVVQELLILDNPGCVWGSPILGWDRTRTQQESTCFFCEGLLLYAV